ncbi:MAG: VOC family protein, partial [Bacteroidota bacterium]
MQPFHLAVPVDDLAKARHFYGTVLGCPEGRTDVEWIDFDLFGHQVVAHLAPKKEEDDHRNEVDGKHVPVPHFGVVLEWQQFENFAARLRQHGVKFEIE